MKSCVKLVTYQNKEITPRKIQIKGCNSVTHWTKSISIWIFQKFDNLLIVKLYPNFRGKKSPITTLKTAGHWTLSETDKFTPHSANAFLSDTSITAVPPNSHLRHPNDLFPSAFRTEILYALFISAMHVTFPSHFILFIGRPDKSLKNFSLFYFCHDFSTIPISRPRYSRYQSVSKRLEWSFVCFEREGLRYDGGRQWVIWREWQRYEKGR
jgi:hypothetical protein